MRLGIGDWEGWGGGGGGGGMVLTKNLCKLNLRLLKWSK